MNNSLFVYGSLMCEDIWRQVVGEGRLLGEAMLADFARYQVRGEDYPAIIQQSGQQVAGLVYTELSQQALEKLDQFEGEFYKRIQIQVMLENARKIPVMTYCIDGEFKTLLTQKAWDFEDFRRQGKQRFMQQYMGFKKA